MARAAGFQVIDEVAGVWAYEYAYARGGRANSLLLRDRNGSLIVVSPGSGMAPEDFAQIDALGSVSALVAPNAFHHLGQASWQKRYPDARVFAPAGAARRIAKKNPELRVFEPTERLMDLMPEGSWLGVPPHMRFSDMAGWVKKDGHYVWCFTDAVVNFRTLPKHPILGPLMRWTGSAPGLHVFRLFAPILLKDRKGYKRWLLEELSTHPPVKIVTGHGAPVLEAEQAARLAELVEREL